MSLDELATSPYRTHSKYVQPCAAVSSTCFRFTNSVSRSLRAPRSISGRSRRPRPTARISATSRTRDPPASASTSHDPVVPRNTPVTTTSVKRRALYTVATYRWLRHSVGPTHILYWKQNHPRPQTMAGNPATPTRCYSMPWWVCSHHLRLIELDQNPRRLFCRLAQPPPVRRCGKPHHYGRVEHPS